ncbi:tetraacyldisaccharide 4'-kinase [Dyadobacter jejuensis]|uniref:Tetraacyldisaccharide 4'-kinase n=1 Tax=Dyadobacter jejuensis TaxID=1082580 RepID=A0A316AI43_9BACT|nr:tetraacyldisaccharide 4'-kinase [Dyadobacter jejuensis]PWJ57321.1 tetraacyldisaccharide 4'-kinase [Dyadobacter jejuensis]
MKQPTLSKLALRPFSGLYGLITGIRNWLYDHEVFAVAKVQPFTISVGNLTVGGTGKTPVTEYLTRLLLPHYDLAILSRGYGRSTKGYLLATPTTDARLIGDEPRQYFEKFAPTVAVAVCESRVKGAHRLWQQYPQKELLLLDDAFQHRAIKRDINILLSDYNRPFYMDHPFPEGRLRETRHGARRADLILVTKCPTSLHIDEKNHITQAIRKYCRPEAPIFFAGIKYGPPILISGKQSPIKRVVLLTGIANPAPFLAAMEQNFEVMGHYNFPDHHNYTEDDLQDMIGKLKNDTFVLTTEKDIVKLKSLDLGSLLDQRLAYVPIEVDLAENQEAFDQYIEQNIKKGTSLNPLK